MLHIKHIPYHSIFSVDWAKINSLIDRFPRTILLKLSIAVLCLLPNAIQPSEYILSRFQRDSVQVEWTEYGPYGDTILYFENRGKLPTMLPNALQAYATSPAWRICLTRVLYGDSVQSRTQISENDSNRLRILRLLATAPQQLASFENVSCHFMTRRHVLLFNNCSIFQVFELEFRSRPYIKHGKFRIAISLLDIFPLSNLEIALLSDRF